MTARVEQVANCISNTNIFGMYTGLAGFAPVWLEQEIIMKIRKANDRGHADFGWLSSFHSFSFGEYHDSAHMGFGSLRVINDDTVAAGAGFPTHPHRDMEIISYVLDGALEHKDSTGGGSIIRPGEVQRMSAGTGIRHSEFNASKRNPVHFLQIWIVPERQGIAPGYEQKEFSASEKQGRLRLVASRDGRDGSVTVHQDADIYASVPGQDGKVSYDLKSGRLAWLQVARGTISLNGQQLTAGDGASIDADGVLTITGKTPDAEILLFDMAA
jgi:quercetin 2,3-dioxygenase